MGMRTCTIKCSLCGKQAALTGDGIDKNYTKEIFAAEGWVFSKYKTMCPECRKKESERFEMEAKKDAWPERNH